MRGRRGVIAFLASLAAVLLLTTACGGDSKELRRGPTDTAPAPVSTTLTAIPSDQQATVPAPGTPTELATPLCFQGPRGDWEALVDFDLDGSLEEISVRFEQGPGGPFAAIALSKSELDVTSGAYHTSVLAEERLAGFAASGPQAGTRSSLWYGDITGDGQNDAVVCVSTPGANDLFTDVVMISYDGEKASTILKKSALTDSTIVLRGSTVEIAVQQDWLGGQCGAITRRYFQWDGSRFAVVGDDREERFQEGVDCASEAPPEPAFTLPRGKGPLES